MGSFKPVLSKLRGQHFLTDTCIVQKIVASAELGSEDIVLEVGPGMGVMTREILPAVKKLFVVELDPLFVRELRKEFDGKESIEIIESDILKIKIPDLPADYKLITNLPYNITSAFLKKFLTETPAPERIVVMLQKEVADKIIASSGMLALMCNLYAECAPVCKASASAFSPPPKVDSAVIRLKPYSPEEFTAKWGIERGESEGLLGFAAKFFADPRKKMCGLLGKGMREACQNALREIGENPDSRPAVLSLEKWVELWKKMRRII